MLMEHLKVHWQDVEGTGGSAIGTAEESMPYTQRQACPET